VAVLEAAEQSLQKDGQRVPVRLPAGGPR
jgi:hypothetical protein